MPEIAVVGHTPVRHGPGDWRCKCGAGLSGGPLGNGRVGARDVMRFHLIDLNNPEHVVRIIGGPDFWYWGGKCELCWAENNGEGCDYAACGCICHDDEDDELAGDDDALAQ